MPQAKLQHIERIKSQLDEWGAPTKITFEQFGISPVKRQPKAFRQKHPKIREKRPPKDGALSGTGGIVAVIVY